ncbi:hypothetical protein AB836_00525 [Rickettsiales bacterium (ex Bugula neritina AB1)]|nr:hypothetical protein AB836_00525 [Rickettsiales bacterium (ex Bugula neritina AB1)]
MIQKIEKINRNLKEIELWPLKIVSPDGSFFYTYTTDKPMNNEKEIIIFLNINQKEHKAWTGKVASKTTKKENRRFLF